MNIKKIVKIVGIVLAILVAIIIILAVIICPALIRSSCSSTASEFPFKKDNYTEIKWWYDLLYNKCLHENGFQSDRGYSSMIK
jgi:hypothetical protein